MDFNYRYNLVDTDKQTLRELLVSTGFFYDYEIQVAIELVETTLEKGEASSGYQFIIAEDNDKILGFSCFGATPCTKDSYDIYWIAVNKDMINKGIGGQILFHTEEKIYKNGGRHIWVETSSRAIYVPTREFYRKKGYEIKARLPDFYGPGDNKVIFLKKCL